MAHVGVAGIDLFYEVEGDGPAVYVLHGGLGLDHQLYRRSLAPLTRSHRVVYLDHRGNGRSERVPDAALTMEQLADDVAELATHLADETFAVLGHSYGGFIAQELLCRHPGRVERAVLVATTPGQLGTGELATDTEPGLALPDAAAELMSRGAPDDAGLAEVMAALLPYYFHRYDADAFEPLLAGTVFRADAMRRGFEVLSGWSAVDRLPSVRCPVLLVAGRHDVFTSCPQAHRMARHLPDATVVVLEESGHFPWLEEPAPFFDAVERFLGAAPE